MRLRSLFASLAICAGLVFAPAIAADTPSLDLDAVRAQQAEIRAGARAASGIYENLPEAKRNELVSRQDRMLAMIQGKQTADDLSESEKLELFNTLEWIEATVNRAEDSRMVCEVRKIIGSNRRERVCRTAAQIRAEREFAREQLERGGMCEVNCGPGG